MPDMTRDQIVQRIGELARAEPAGTEHQSLLSFAKDLITRDNRIPISQMDEDDCFWYARAIGAGIGVGTGSDGRWCALYYPSVGGWGCLGGVEDSEVDALRNALRHVAKMEHRYVWDSGQQTLVKVGPCYEEETDSLGKPEVLADG